MAVTAIWSVKGTVKRLIDYIVDERKIKQDVELWTSDCKESCFPEEKFLDEEAKINSLSMGKAICYIEDSKKTSQGFFITGINCSVRTAYKEMKAVKKRFGKEGGISCFHAYQSFPKGEGDPDLIHRIGVDLARKLWGDSYQVVVATHLDKQHLHNHFVFNSVSFVDGKKYNDCKSSYLKMRQTSDSLCLEHDLSIIETERGISRSYVEWLYSQKEKPNWLSLMKEDIDKAILNSFTETQFFSRLNELGYTIKVGKDISIKPVGRNRFFRLHRRFGDMYTRESIKKRILEKGTWCDPKVKLVTNPWTDDISRYGLSDMFVKYRDLLENVKDSKDQYYFLKEDTLNLKSIAREANFLVEHGIENDEKLRKFLDSENLNVKQMVEERQVLRNKLRKKSLAENVELKNKIELLNNKIKHSRDNICLCSSIKRRTDIIKEKFKKLEMYRRGEHESRRRSNKQDLGTWQQNL